VVEELGITSVGVRVGCAMVPPTVAMGPRPAVRWAAVGVSDEYARQGGDEVRLAGVQMGLYRSLGRRFPFTGTQAF